MKTQFALCSWILVCLCCAFGINGCGGGDEEEVEEVKVNFVSASPAPGSTLEPDATISLTFDGTPTGVSVDKGIATVTGHTVTLSGPFRLGELNLTVRWDDGRQPFTYTVNVETPEGMVFIPAGQFQMGSNDGEADNHEQPVHTVHLDAFFMDEHEVTNLEYKAFLLENPRWQKIRIDKRFHNGSYLKHWSGNNYPSGKANHPVTWMSWYAAMAYAEWAEKRLPTEAEWEYAARGGVAGKKYPSGKNTISTREANYNNHVDDTTAVGRYAANGYGLYDMAGNVYEWCLDEYDGDFYFVSRNSRNPISGARTIQWILDNFASLPTNSNRVLRGGAWHSDPWYLRVAYRSVGSPAGSLGPNIGFRCVRAVTP